MQSIITTTLYLLTILVPLTFTTINFELFEFPKFILLLAGTLIITVAWLIHLYQTRDFKFKLTGNIQYSLFLTLFTQSISTIFSINPYTSFWGYYSRFHGGLLSTICYTIIYFAVVKWMDKKSTQKLIKISIVTSFLISLYAIAEHFGIDKNFWVQDVQNRVFSTLGQPNWLAAYLLPNLFLTLYLSQSTRARRASPLHYFIFATLFIALIFTRSRSGLLAFGISFIVYWLLLARQFSYVKIESSLIQYSIILLSFLVICGSPFTPSLPDLLTKKPEGVPTAQPQGTALETGGTESGDIRKVVWSGAIKLVQKYPFLGTGPETFAYTYYWVRPTAHNVTSEWDFLYNKAHNEYLNIAAGTGILGLLAYLYFHYAVFATSFTRMPKSKKMVEETSNQLRSLYPVLGASVVSFAITNFFGFSVIPVYLMMILLATFPATITRVPIDHTPFDIRYSLFFVLVLIYPANLFIADINYAKGKAYLDAGKLEPSISFLQKSLGARPGLDLYHATLGEALASYGQAEQAVAQAQATKKLNPYHLNYFKSRAKVYLTLAGSDPNYNNLAAAELTSARTLAPTDPKLAYNLGLVYTRLSKPELAAKQLTDAIALKPNYAEPYYALTLLYEQTKQTDLIPPLLTGAKSNLATYSALLKDKIEKYLPDQK